MIQDILKFYLQDPWVETKEFLTIEKTNNTTCENVQCILIKAIIIKLGSWDKFHIPHFRHSNPSSVQDICPINLV